MTVVFDLGIVLSSPTNLFTGLGAELGVSPGLVEENFWRFRHAYDCGSADEEFWGSTLEFIPGAPALTPDLLARLVAADIAGWKTPRPAARAILQRLADAGAPTAVLSNAPTSFATAAPGFDWYPLVGTWFFSGPLGIAKPDPAIYTLVTDTLDEAPGELWFVDDKQENIAAASALGWNAHLWSSDDDTRDWLRSEGLWPAPTSQGRARERG